MKKFPWDCNDCPMLHTYDLSVDDLTHVCLWSKTQIDDCDRYKSAECPLEKHDEEIREDERRKFAEWLEENNMLVRWEHDDEYVCNGVLNACNIIEMYEQRKAEIEEVR